MNRCRLPAAPGSVSAPRSSGRAGPSGAEAFLLSRAYVDALQGAGAIALMLPPDAWVADHPDDVLEGLDGLMLAGGADIDPSSYGGPRHPKVTNTRVDRDRAEIALFTRAMERDLPVLGICRGMQLMNVARGGTLIQHLPDDVGHTDHRRALGSFDNADHDVRLEPGSLAARACGEVKHATKSHHHQAVAELGEGVVASGWSVLDDLVEAIELPEAGRALGCSGIRRSTRGRAWCGRSCTKRRSWRPDGRTARLTTLRAPGQAIHARDGGGERRGRQELLDPVAAGVVGE